MARATFGGGIADFVIQAVGGGITKLAPATLTFWSAKGGGTQYTDLLVGGSAAASVSVGSDGQVPQFQGPDGVYTMWADGGGSRVQMVAVADAVALATAPTDTTVAAAINTPGGATAAALAQLKVWARNPDLLISGAVTRDANGAATSAPVAWPDGTPGTYTATTVSTAFPGAVDAYTITYGSPVTKTYTQPTITRDATTGAATNVPAITVA